MVKTVMETQRWPRENQACETAVKEGEFMSAFSIRSTAWLRPQTWPRPQSPPQATGHRPQKAWSHLQEAWLHPLGGLVSSQEVWPHPQEAWLRP